MVIVKKTNSRPSHSGAGTSRGGGSNHIFKTKSMSYYSNSTSESLTPKNYRIFAFSNRGGPLHRMGTTRCEDVDDQHVSENMTIVNHLKKLVKQGGDQKKKRKRKNNEIEKDVDEFEGLYVIDEKDEKIDVKVVSSTGDAVFESVLKEMTDGIATEHQVLGVLYSLDGTWGSDRKRTKYVDAAVFAKLLPAKWRILLSLRPRATQPSLYCRSFVSPSGVHLKSCKEVAFYLKSQLLTSHTSPPGELAIMQIDGKKISLKLLESNGDKEFQSVLNTMTDGMVKEDELLDVMNTLDGTWGSNRKRRKYVDAAVLAKILPVNWKILLSLRPRARQPSLYCRRFVSPSGVHFNSCKDVAFYLKSQFVTTDTSPPEEVGVLQIENTCQVDLESGSLVPRSTTPAIKVELPDTDDLRNVPLYHLRECQYCNSSFTSMDELEYHIQNVHGNTVRRSDKDTLTRKVTAPRGLLLIREPKYPPPIKEKSVVRKTVLNKEVDHLDDTVMSLDELIDFPINEEGSSSFPKPLTESKKSSEAKGKVKTRCMWCLFAFFLEHVDAETHASSSGFICPKCKVDAAWKFDNAFSELRRDVGK